MSTSSPNSTPAPVPVPSHLSWRHPPYLLSTDQSLIPIQSLTSAFAQPWMYWAKPLPAAAMKQMIDNSMCFGLYGPSPVSTSPPPTTPNLIGFARLITDHITFAYLTDVYILPDFQGHGLGKWMIDCVQGWIEAQPYLRRSMLVTGRGGKGVGFYETRMKMERLEGGELMPMSWVGPGWGGT